MGGCAANYKLSPKAPKISVFSSKYLIFFSFLTFWRQRVWECGDLKIVSRSQNLHDFYFARIPYPLYLLISVLKQFF